MFLCVATFFNRLEFGIFPVLCKERSTLLPENQI